MKTFSYSAISTADRCRRLYKYVYVDKLTPEEPKSANLSFGSAIHCGVEEILTIGSHEAFNLLVKSTPELNETHEILGNRLLANFKKNHAQDFNIMMLEERVGMDLPEDGLRLEGTPDFVGEYNGVPSIVDFKTSSQRYNEDQIACSDQMLLYHYIVAQTTGYVAKQLVYVVFIKTKDPYIQVISKSIDSFDYEARIANILDKCKELDKISQFPQNYSMCLSFGQKCPFWDKCHSKK